MQVIKADHGNLPRRHGQHGQRSEILAGIDTRALTALIREIDERRDGPNLSSSLRLAVLRFYRGAD